MNAGEFAALIGAAAAFLTALAALTNARNSKDVADKLRKEVDTLNVQRKQLLEHNDYQDALLMDREKKIGTLTQKIERWQAWSVTVGQMMNKMQLRIDYLTQQQRGGVLKVTKPLPALPTDDEVAE